MLFLYLQIIFSIVPVVVANMTWSTITQLMLQIQDGRQ